VCVSSSGMLASRPVEQLAWDKLGGDAEERAQEAAGTRESAGELCVVGGAGIVDARVDEAPIPAPTPAPSAAPAITDPVALRARI
jgi:hypothetical protein